MSGDSDLIRLYSQRILALAANIPLTERLESPDATIRRRAPLCGSTVTVDVEISDDRISAYGQDVKACALGQAAASVVGTHVVGCRVEDIRKARDQLLAMLKSDGPAPDAPFQDLEVLTPARDYKNRQASIMLVLEATLEAVETAQKAKCA